jgi:hypothetical protein
MVISAYYSDSGTMTYMDKRWLCFERPFVKWRDFKNNRPQKAKITFKLDCRLYSGENGGLRTRILMLLLISGLGWTSRFITSYSCNDLQEYSLALPISFPSRIRDPVSTCDV